jgi:hypothetical protein
MRRMFTKSKTSPIEALKAARDKTAARLNDEAAALERAKAATIEAAASDDNALLSAAVESCRRIELRHLAFVEALAKADRGVEDAIAEEREKADRTQREATAKDLSARADALEKAADPLADVLAASLEALEGGRPIYGEVGIFAILRELAKSLPDALRTLSAEVRKASVATLDPRSGRPAVLSPPLPALVQPSTPPEEPMVTLIATKPLRWIRPGFGPQFAQIGDRFDLSPALAEKALRWRVAMRPEDQNAQMYILSRSGRNSFPDRGCVDLDAEHNPLDPDVAAAAAEPENYRSNEGIRKIPIPRGAIEAMTGTRSFDGPDDAA